jgi:Cdc6-like AAA superfamily ATPase
MTFTNCGKPRKTRAIPPALFDGQASRQDSRRRRETFLSHFASRHFESISETSSRARIPAVYPSLLVSTLRFSDAFAHNHAALSRRGHQFDIYNPLPVDTSSTRTNLLGTGLLLVALLVKQQLFPAMQTRMSNARVRKNVSHLSVSDKISKSTRRTKPGKGQSLIIRAPAPPSSVPSPLSSASLVSPPPSPPPPSIQNTNAVCAATALSLGHISAVSSYARGAEAAELDSLLRGPAAASVYVCGTPGAGKTVTVDRVVSALGPAVRIVSVSCAGISSPGSVFDIIADGLGVGGQGREGIAAFARDGAGGPAVVVLDEIDFMPTTVLYAVYEWPRMAGSAVSVVGISNAIDLPVKAMPWLRAANAMPTIIPFRPYNADELIDIVRVRLEGAGETSALPALALSFAAKKVAATSGDARVLLDVCRESVLSLQRQPSTSALGLIANIFARRGRASAAVDTIRTLPVQQQLALCVLANAEKRFAAVATSGDGSKTIKGSSAKAAAMVKKVTMGTLYESFVAMCSKVSVPAVGFSDFTDICCNSLSANHNLIDVTDVKRRGSNKGCGSAALRGRIVRLKAVTVADVQAGLSDRGFLSLIVGKET